MNGKNRVLRVFLDSNDYSTLSDPAKATSELTTVVDSLRRNRDECGVRFFFSATVVSEMAPLDGTYVEHARLRFQLLNDLCEGNSLRWHEDLLRAEIPAVLGVGPEVTPAAAEGVWLPTEAMASRLDLLAGMNRASRRATHKTFAAMLRKNQMPADLASSPYPPRVKNALMQVAAGASSEECVRSALIDELSDPVWFLSYILSAEDQCREFSEIVRASARGMREATEAAMLVAQNLDSALSKDESIVVKRRFWKEASSSGYLSVVSSLAEHFGFHDQKLPSTDVIASKAPGVTTMLKTVYSSLWPSMQTTPRSPSNSDFVDALHATYAPYVDVFRADQFMAQHIAKILKPYGTTVVASWLELPKAIEQRVREMRSRAGVRP